MDYVQKGRIVCMHILPDLFFSFIPTLLARARISTPHAHLLLPLSPPKFCISLVFRAGKLSLRRTWDRFYLWLSFNCSQLKFINDTLIMSKCENLKGRYCYFVHTNREKFGLQLKALSQTSKIPKVFEAKEDPPPDLVSR